MKVSKQITGSAKDWQFTFDQANLNDWTIMTQEMNNLERIQKLLPRLTGVANIAYDDGTPITFEQIQAREAPIAVYIAMTLAWNDAVSNAYKVEAEEKNESTGDSSDSSEPGSSSPA
jgi:hypothetical protein